MKHSFLSLATGVALALGALAPAAHANIVNGDFASGLAGWTTGGDASARLADSIDPSRLWLTTASSGDDNPGRNASGVDPLLVAIGSSTLEGFVGVPVGALDPAGTFGFEGSAAKQSFSAAANSRVSFRWDLGTADLSGDPFLADSAFVVIDGQLHTLGDITHATLPGTDGNAAHTGWTTFSFALGSATSHSIAFGVMDVGDNAGASTLAITNVAVSAVPESPTLALMAAGLGLLGLQRRRSRR